MEKDAVKRRGRPAKAAGLRSDLILPVALVSFAESGFEAANLRQIAAAASVDVALVSHRYGSKLGLWRAVVDSLAERFLGELSRRAGEGERSLRDSLELMTDLVCDQPATAMFLVRETGQQAERFEYFYEKLVKPVHDMMLPLVRAENGKRGKARYDEDVFFFAFTGAIAITVTMRPFIARFSESAKNDTAFKEAFKNVLFSLGAV